MAGEQATTFGDSGIQDGVVTVTPVVTASTPYDADDCVGGLQTVRNFYGQGGLAALLESLCVLDANGNNAEYKLLLFGAAPSASTFVDGDEATLAVADVAKVIAQIAVAAADYVVTSGFSLADYGAIAKLLQASPASTTLWLAIITTGTPVFNATNDLTFKFGVLRS